MECHEPVEHGNLDAGTLTLSLGNEPTGVVLRGIETIGAGRKTYTFRVQTEWAQRNVVNVIERMSVSPTMPTDREGCPSRNEIRIIKGDGVFSLVWGGVIGGTWHPLHRMAKKLRLVYDMLKEDAVAGIEESEPRLVVVKDLRNLSYSATSMRHISMIGPAKCFTCATPGSGNVLRRSIRCVASTSEPV